MDLAVGDIVETIYKQYSGPKTVTQLIWSFDRSLIVGARLSPFTIGEVEVSLFFALEEITRADQQASTALECLY